MQDPDYARSVRPGPTVINYIDYQDSESESTDFR